MSEIDPDLEATILKLLRSGVTYEVIRETVHCSKTTISEVKKKHGTELGIPAGTVPHGRHATQSASGNGRGSVKPPPTVVLDDPKRYDSIPVGNVKELLWAKMKACPAEKLPSLVQEWQSLPADPDQGNADGDDDGDALEGDDDPFAGVHDFGGDLGECNTRWIVKQLFDEFYKMQEEFYNLIDAIHNEGRVVMPSFENDWHLGLLDPSDPEHMAEMRVDLLDRWDKAGIPMETIASLVEMWPDLDDPDPEKTYAARRNAETDRLMQDLKTNPPPRVDARALYQAWMRRIAESRQAHGHAPNLVLAPEDILND